MVGSFGCRCEKCNGSGTLAMEIRGRLCAIERLLGVELVITRGFCCEQAAQGAGLPESEQIHTERGPDGAGLSRAVDFYPRTGLGVGNRADSRGARWGNRRYDFLELCRPFFDQVWLVVSATDPNKWSVHGEIEKTSKTTTVIIPAYTGESP